MLSIILYNKYFKHIPETGNILQDILNIVHIKAGNITLTYICIYQIKISI